MEPFKVHILGCGSALPTGRHFPSAQVVEVRGKMFLIDCGEGTQLQLRRAHVGFNKISHVFISHLHGDHCLGLVGMLSTFGMMGRTAPMYVHAEQSLQKVLDDNMRLFCRDLGYELVFEPLPYSKRTVIYEDKGVTVETLPLEHRMPTCGFIVSEKASLPHIRRDMIDFYNIPLSQIQNIKQGGGWTTPDGDFIPHERLTVQADAPRRYAYCSDTRYMPALASQIQGVNMLYHESTYSEQHSEMAGKYFHSTARQAATVARDAAVGKLLLGHFSSRYDDEQVLLDEATAVFPNTLLAKELQTFSVE